MQIPPRKMLSQLVQKARQICPCIVFHNTYYGQIDQGKQIEQGNKFMDTSSKSF